MIIIERMKFASKLWMLIAFFAVGLIVFSYYAHQTIQYLKVNGPIYDEIVQGKDLIADILPPPNYLVESYLVTLQMLDETDNSKLQELVKKSESLRKDYDTRHEYWTNALAEGDIKDLMVRQSHEAAERFLDIRDKQVIPAVLSGKREEAKKIANGILKEAYEQHRAKVDAIVEKTNVKNAEVEKQAAASISARTASLFFMGIGILLLSILAAYFFIIKRLVGKIKNLVDSAESISQGDIKKAEQFLDDGNITDIETKDEITVLTRSFSSMVDNIKEQAVAVDMIAQGNLDIAIEAKSEEDILAKGIIQVASTLRGLIDETGELVNAANNGNLSVRGNTDKFKGGYKEIVTGINSTLDSLIGPLNMAAEYIDRISKGDIPDKITEEYKGDFNNIKNNLNIYIDNLTLMLAKMEEFYIKQKSGDIEFFIDEKQFQGAYRQMIKGVNEGVKLYVDIVLKVLNTVSSYGEGNFKAVLEQLPGKQIIANKITDQIRTNLQELIAEVEQLTKEAVNGNLSARAGSDKFKGGWVTLIDGVNDTLNALINPLNMAAMYVDKISKGNIPPKITEEYHGDFNLLKNNLNTCIDSINNLISDVNLLSESAVNGKLSTRVDVTKHSGDFRRIVLGVNNTMDAIIDPLTVAADCIKKISKGEIPDKITEDYKGDFNEIKNSINYITEIINTFVEEIGIVLTGVKEGNLGERANDKKVEGVWKEILHGNNNIIDAFVKPLALTSEYIKKISNGEMPEKITEQYNGDFNIIISNLNKCIDAVNLLISDTNKLSQAALDGNLSTRADETEHNGDFRKIIRGINETLNAVVEPVTEGVLAMEKMADGDLTVRITTEYKGEHQLIKNSINKVCEALSVALSDVKEAVISTSSAGEQINASAERIASGSISQSEQASEIASSVEEMAKTILENANNANNATEAAKLAGGKAKEGGRIVEETIGGMSQIADVVKKSATLINELGKRSDQIGEIVQVINDIADQTNMLALNAAIEAARAGEQGRGFAVVADEVKKLADRTTKATKEISVMITQIQDSATSAVNSMEEGTTNVEKGMELVNKAGASLREIISASEQVVGIASLVANASQGQSVASEQISKSIETIASVSQESADGANQVAQAAEDLGRLTINLEELTNRFKIDENGEGFRKAIDIQRN